MHCLLCISKSHDLMLHMHSLQSVQCNLHCMQCVPNCCGRLTNVGNFLSDSWPCTPYTRRTAVELKHAMASGQRIWRAHACTRTRSTVGMHAHCMPGIRMHACGNVKSIMAVILLGETCWGETVGGSCPGACTSLIVCLLFLI